MEKILGYGRRALFLVRVLSGYEERRIWSLRLQIQQRVEQAVERKSAFRVSEIQEQAILSEFSRLVRAMQELNQTIEETEIAIDEYFKPIDRNVAAILSMQLESREKNLKAIARVAQERACLQITTPEKTTEIKNLASGCKGVAAITAGREQTE